MTEKQQLLSFVIMHREQIMYVCLCYGITDTQIEQAVEQSGVGNMRQLREQLGAGSQCGKCVQQAQAIIDNTIIDERLFKQVC